MTTSEMTRPDAAVAPARRTRVDLWVGVAIVVVLAALGPVHGLL